MEYNVCQLFVADYEARDGLQALLNDGWELVSMVPVKGYYASVLAVLKRGTNEDS